MLKKIIRRLLILIIQPFHRVKARFTLPRLRSHENAKLRAIGNALYESLNKTLSTEEKKIISLVEQRRTFLLNSKKEIAVIDYGAGSPGLNRKKEQMVKGDQSTASISDICKASTPVFWATFLFKLVRKLKPLACVELGTSLGISASYQAAALNLNGKGNLYTLEGSPEIAKIAEETINLLGIENTSVIIGPFFTTLRSVLKTAKPIDLFFNDGHHDHDAVVQYFYEALQFLSNEAVMVFDDISWSEGMRKAWKEIEEDNRVIATIDLQTMGIAIVGNYSTTKQNYRIPL